MDEVFAALLDRDAVLYIDGGELRYAGPELPLSDPIHVGIREHREILTELFTYAPNGRCVFTGCYRLPAGGSKIACQAHRAEMGTH